MPEKWGEGEIESAFEAESALYDALLTADLEVNTLMRELDEYLVQFTDRVDAERSALKTLVPRIEGARDRSRHAFDRWLEATKKQ